MGVRARVKRLDGRINNGINSHRPEDLTRRWWHYLAFASLFVVAAYASFFVGLEIVALTVLVPTIVMGFMSGFYYCERLRSQGKTGGRFGPSRLPD